jgi:hypothetical protein
MCLDADGNRSQVVDAEWEGTLAVAIQESKAEELNAETKAKAGKARQRYLDHLAQDQATGDRDSDEDMCILCRSEFTRGYMTHWYVLWDVLGTIAETRRYIVHTSSAR